MPVRPTFRPNAYLAVTVVSWGLNFVAVKEVYKELSPPALGLSRFLVMWLGLMLVCLVRRESLRFPKEDCLKLLYLGFISMGVYMFLFLQGMHGSGATEGAILLQLSPVFTALLSALLGLERFSAKSMLGALIAFGGTALILYQPVSTAENNLAANFTVMASALVWAYSVTVMKPLLEKYSPLRVLTLSMAGGLPVMVVYGLFPSLHTHSWSSLSTYTWAMFFHVSVISGVVAFLCFYQGVKQVGGTGATLYQFLVPAAAMGFGLLIRGSSPTLLQVAGSVIVLVGVAYALRSRMLSQPTENGAGKLADI